MEDVNIGDLVKINKKIKKTEYDLKNTSRLFIGMVAPIQRIPTTDNIKVNGYIIPNEAFEFVKHQKPLFIKNVESFGDTPSNTVFQFSETHRTKWGQIMYKVICPVSGREIYLPRYLLELSSREEFDRQQTKINFNKNLLNDYGIVENSFVKIKRKPTKEENRLWNGVWIDQEIAESGINGVYLQGYKGLINKYGIVQRIDPINGKIVVNIDGLNKDFPVFSLEVTDIPEYINFKNEMFEVKSISNGKMNLINDKDHIESHFDNEMMGILSFEEYKILNSNEKTKELNLRDLNLGEMYVVKMDGVIIAVLTLESVIINKISGRVWYLVYEGVIGGYTTWSFDFDENDGDIERYDENIHKLNLNMGVKKENNTNSKEELDDVIQDIKKQKK